MVSFLLHSPLPSSPRPLLTHLQVRPLEQRRVLQETRHRRSSNSRRQVRLDYRVRPRRRFRGPEDRVSEASPAVVGCSALGLPLCVPDGCYWLADQRRGHWTISSRSGLQHLWMSSFSIHGVWNRSTRGAWIGLCSISRIIRFAMYMIDLGTVHGFYVPSGMWARISRCFSLLNWFTLSVSRTHLFRGICRTVHGRDLGMVSRDLVDSPVDGII